MPEVDSVFPRAWIEFQDPADAEQVFRCDLTWLTSNWTCIFGNGCPGIYASAPEVGCCALGAHFSDQDDEERVAEWVELLDDESWEHRPKALNKRGEVARKRWVETDDEGDRKTRVVGDACIFHNSQDFPGGYGCALHHLALRKDVHFVETKPDVCWQLPLRRTFRDVELNDGTSYTEVSIGEYDRGGWGPGRPRLRLVLHREHRRTRRSRARVSLQRDRADRADGAAGVRRAGGPVRGAPPLALGPGAAPGIAPALTARCLRGSSRYPTPGVRCAFRPGENQACVSTTSSLRPDPGGSRARHHDCRPCSARSS